MTKGSILSGILPSEPCHFVKAVCFLLGESCCKSQHSLQNGVGAGHFITLFFGELEKRMRQVHAHVCLGGSRPVFLQNGLGVKELHSTEGQNGTNYATKWIG